jgi:hypothetical protein
MSQTLNILNHYKHCFLRLNDSKDSKFTFEKPIQIDKQKLNWDKILDSAFEIASKDRSLKEIFEVEEFLKTSFLEKLKKFYFSIFEKDILDPEVHYFHNANPRKEEMGQTQDMSVDGARS